jgi:hypothetical protein
MSRKEGLWLAIVIALVLAAILVWHIANDAGPEWTEHPSPPIAEPQFDGH